MTGENVRFEVLGPVRARVGSGEVPLGPPRQRAVLTALLLRAPRPVSAEAVIDTVWGASAPAGAVNLVQKYMSGLRGALPEPAGIVLTDAGYALTGADGAHALDLWEFEQSLAGARALRAAGNAAQAAAALTRATSLWRGPLAEGLSGPGIELERDRMAERLVGAYEDLYAVGLVLGRGPRDVPELARLAARHPQRERLHELLMRALVQAGRPTEALEVYAGVRGRLAEEYGTEPGPGLRAAQRWVLAGGDPEPEPAAGGPAGPARPAPRRVSATEDGAGADVPPVPVRPEQLPHPVAGFTGREAEAGQVTGLLLSGGTPLVCVEGTAGVGKTTLAVHCAHRVSGAFPDGRLFADLRGFDPLAPARPADVLGDFLRALGVPARQVPDGVDARAALFRSVLAGRRVLVVLDNAADAAQLRPLLPGPGRCAVLATSRRGLTGLAAVAGAHRVVLPVLSPGESALLLRTALGPAAAGDEGPLAEIARLCGHLPLALRVVAAGAATVPGLSPGDLATHLAAEGPLASAAAPDDERVSVTASLTLSYRRLDPAARRMLRLLGLVPGPDLTRRDAAAVSGLPAADTGRALTALTTAHLLEQHRPGRFRFPHDLLRAYAGQRAGEEEDPAVRRAAVGRLAARYTRLARALGGGQHRARPVAPDGTVGGPGAEPEAPAEAELPNVAAMVEYTARHGPYPVAWTLASLLHDVCKRRTLVTEWLTLAAAGLRAAHTAGDRLAAAGLSLTLVDACLTAGRVEAADEHARRALAVGRQEGWPDVVAAACEQLGRGRWLLGDLPRAGELLAEAVDTATAAGLPLATAKSLGALARVEADSGAWPAAHRHYRRALRISRALGVRYLEAVFLAELGVVHRGRGEPATALGVLESALALSRDDPDLCRPAALAHAYLAEVHAVDGREEEARAATREALRIAGEQGDPWALTEAHNAAGRSLTLLGATGEATDRHRAALRLSRTLPYRRGELHALAGLFTATGRPAWRREITAVAGHHAYDLTALLAG
ncbi:BTAD domain-containing putative transcriptional regulator [Streptomyces cheonanensis]|uniref:BTAD domain-containing putative transcriptional regulator n=2 Tax=Streptomyces TaxID=1883 RepID=A0ABP5GH48_9ACTN